MVDRWIGDSLLSWVGVVCLLRLSSVVGWDSATFNAASAVRRIGVLEMEMHGDWLLLRCCNSVTSQLHQIGSTTVV